MYAFDGCRMPVALKNLPQASVFLQSPCFDDNDRILWLGLHHGFEGRDEVAGSSLDPDGTTATEQADCIDLIGEPPAVAGKLIALDADHLKRVIHAFDGSLDHQARAFADQSGVSPVKEIESYMPGRLCQIGLSLPMADRNHVSSWPEPRPGGS